MTRPRVTRFTAYGAALLAGIILAVVLIGSLFTRAPVVGMWLGIVAVFVWGTHVAADEIEAWWHAREDRQIVGELAWHSRPYYAVCTVCDGMLTTDAGPHDEWSHVNWPLLMAAGITYHAPEPHDV